MNRIKFSEKINIRCKPFQAFDYTQNYKNRLNWDTFLKRADLINGADQAALGVKAYCVARNGIGMETEYVSYRRPKVSAVKMTSGPYMFKSFLGSWTFHKTTEQCTEVIFLYSFQLRFPFNLASRYIKKTLRQNVKQRLRDLKQHIEARM